MSLPKKWWLDKKLSDLYTQRRIRRMKLYRQTSNTWTETICELRGMGLPPKEAIYRANCKFVKVLIHDAGIPDEMVWNGREGSDDSECECCNLLFKAGLISQVGKMRYLGTFRAGNIQVAEIKWIEDYDYSTDVEYPNILAAFRCEVCGNENTED